MTKRLILSVSTVLAFLTAPPAASHDLRMTDTLLILKADGTFQVDMTCDLDALALGAPPGADSAELAARLRALPSGELQAHVERLRDYFERRIRLRFDGEPVAISVSFPAYGTALAADAAVPTVLGLVARLEGRVPEGAESFTFRASRAFPSVHLTVLRQAGAAERTILEQGVPSEAIPIEEIPAEPDRLEVAGRYLVFGFWHIVPAGLDHILFVLGLYLLSVRWRPLLWQVSAFTLAHTTSLALATYGVLSVPSSVVEPLIALSIVYVAVENVVTKKLRPWRVWVVFGFGLLHGLGFAGVLGELGLPRSEYVTALLAFNAGVELGQLGVILAAILALGFWREEEWYRRRVTVPASLLIAAVALYWSIERVLA